jgi:hypothetical protein
MPLIAQDVTPAARQRLEEGKVMSSDTPVDLKYEAGHFNLVPHSLAAAFWDFSHRPDTVVSLRTATAMGRPAVEGILDSLVNEFGATINERAAKQVIGHVVRLRMESLGYEVDKTRTRTRSGIFSTGITFRPAVLPGPDAFNRWLDAQVTSPDGEFDPEKLAAIAHEWGVSFSAKKCNPAIRRLELGALLRAVVPPSDYEMAEKGADHE